MVNKIVSYLWKLTIIFIIFSSLNLLIIILKWDFFLILETYWQLRIWKKEIGRMGEDVVWLSLWAAQHMRCSSLNTHSIHFSNGMT